MEHLTLTGSTANGTGNNQANTIQGNGAKNSVSGLAGNDILAGGSNDDTLTGGAGADRMTGNAGKDKFIFTAGFGKDTITDFNGGADAVDRVLISKALLANFTAVLSHASIVGGDVVVAANAANKITFANLDQVSDLHQNDFLFT